VRKVFATLSNRYGSNLNAYRRELKLLQSLFFRTVSVCFFSTEQPYPSVVFFLIQQRCHGHLIMTYNKAIIL